MLARLVAGQGIHPPPTATPRRAAGIVEGSEHSIGRARDGRIGRVVVVRLARRDEMPALQRIERLAGQPFRGIGMDEIAEYSPLPVEELARYQRAGRAWVAREGGELVAYLLLDVVGDAAHIEQVSVDPAFARRGIGRRLLDTAADWAGRRGLRRLTLTTFEHVPWNAPYYRRLGFTLVPQGDQTPELRAIREHERAIGLDRWPRVVMAKALDPAMDDDGPMDLTTPLCALLGIDLPIVQAPIGSSSTPELAAAVSEAGGLGTLAQTWFEVPEVRERLRRASSLTDRPIGVNLILDLPIRDKLEACLDEGASIVSTFWGDPGPVRDVISSAGALHLHTVGTVADAVLAAERGVDVIVAQGWEAGGHVHGTIGTMALVPAVVDAVAPLPVIAAGGIADGRGLVAALALGAQAAWLGTRFVAADEARVHDVYRRRVLDATADDSVHGLAYDGGWPGAAGRTLRNATLRAWEAAGRPTAPDRPGEGEIVARDASGREFERYNDMMPLPGMTGDLEEMALYAGQSVGLVRSGGPAREILAQLVDETRAQLARLEGRVSA